MTNYATMSTAERRAALINILPAFVAEFGPGWTATPDDEWSAAALRAPDGGPEFRLMISTYPGKGKASFHLAQIKMPSLREYPDYVTAKNITPYDKRDTLPTESADVSLPRLFENPARVAREFDRRVVSSVRAWWPAVAEYQAQRKEAVAGVESMIAEIKARFPGAKEESRRDSSDRVRVYIPNAPTLIVQMGGHVTFDCAPFAPLAATLDYVAAIKAARS